MTKLLITRGLPGSGKSTYARAWVKEDPQRRAQIERDHFREMMHGGPLFNAEGRLAASSEVAVTIAQHAAIKELLRQGVDVIVSDTNLPQRNARELAKIGVSAGAEIEVIDLTSVALEVCVNRNEDRTGKDRVPERVIRDMHGRYIAGRPYPLPSPVEDEYHGTPGFAERVPGLPSVVIVDIDGTVADKGTRYPHDYASVAQDTPKPDVIEVVRAAYAAGHDIIFLSGRPMSCFTDTHAWLEEHVPVNFLGPAMRTTGDYRKDSVVKRELFDKHIRGKYNVAFVLDDRAQVVRMWREELGLTCLQVAEGNF